MTSSTTSSVVISSMTSSTTSSTGASSTTSSTGASSTTGASSLGADAATLSPPAQELNTSSTETPEAAARASAER